MNTHWKLDEDHANETNICANQKYDRIIDGHNVSLWGFENHWWEVSLLLLGKTMSMEVATPWQPAETAKKRAIKEVRELLHTIDKEQSSE